MHTVNTREPCWPHINIYRRLHWTLNKGSCGPECNWNFIWRAWSKNTLADDLICAWIYFWLALCADAHLLPLSKDAITKMPDGVSECVAGSETLRALAQMSERSEEKPLSAHFFISAFLPRRPQQQKTLLCLQLPKLLWFFNGQSCGQTSLRKFQPCKIYARLPITANLRAVSACQNFLGKVTSNLLQGFAQLVLLCVPLEDFFYCMAFVLCVVLARNCLKPQMDT